MYDPDQYAERSPELIELDKTLAALQDCDLGAWDQDFVDSLVKRMTTDGNRMKLTPRQWGQLERLKGKYNA